MLAQMCEPHSRANLLTSPSDDTWKAVRKAVAASFSVHNIKRKLPVILARVNQLLARIRALGPSEAVDVDQVSSVMEGGGGVARAVRAAELLGRHWGLRPPDAVARGTPAVWPARAVLPSQRGTVEPQRRPPHRHPFT
jgi:hypothetical protein